MLALIAVLLFGVEAQESTFVVGLWPGEGRPQFTAKGSELVLRENPTAGSRVTRRLKTRRGVPIAFDEVQYHTVRSGRFVAQRNAVLTGRVLGQIAYLSREAYYHGHYPTREVAVAAGAAIEYLQYRAEGTCFVRFWDQVIDADPCPTHEDRSFRLTIKPETVLWIRVLVAQRPAGWLRVDQAAVEAHGRTF